MSDSYPYIRLSVPNFEKTEDYIHWMRRASAIFSFKDPSYIALKEKTDDMTARALTDWTEKNGKVKSTILFCLGDNALAKTHYMVHEDDRTDKELSDNIQII